MYVNSLPKTSSLKTMFVKDISATLQRGQNMLGCFLGQHYLVVDPRAAEFLDLLHFARHSEEAKMLRASPAKKGAGSQIRYASFFLPSISASLKRLTYFFFFVFSFLPLLFASICLSFLSCFSACLCRCCP